MYYLHAIKIESKVIISRGKNKKETINYLVSCLPKHTYYEIINYIPINAKNLYDKNHDKNWFNSKPHYVKD